MADLRVNTDIMRKTSTTLSNAATSLQQVVSNINTLNGQIRGEYQGQLQEKVNPILSGASRDGYQLQTRSLEQSTKLSAKAKEIDEVMQGSVYQVTTASASSAWSCSSLQTYFNKVGKLGLGISAFILGLVGCKPSSMETKITTPTPTHPPTSPNQSSDQTSGIFKPIVWAAPHVDQLLYKGNYRAGEYICSAAALTVALKYFLGDSTITLEAVADGLVDQNYLKIGDAGGLQSGDYLEEFINHNQSQYPVKAIAECKQFDPDWMAEQIKNESLVIMQVDGHYTIATGYRLETNGTYSFYINDSYRGHWSNNSINAPLNNEWVSADDLEKTYNLNNHWVTVVSKR